MRSMRQPVHEGVVSQMKDLFLAFSVPAEGKRKLLYYSVNTDQQPDAFSCGLYALASAFLIASRIRTPADMSLVSFNALLAPEGPLGACACLAGRRRR